MTAQQRLAADLAEVERSAWAAKSAVPDYLRHKDRPAPAGSTVLLFRQP